MTSNSSYKNTSLSLQDDQEATGEVRISGAAVREGEVRNVTGTGMP